MTWLTHHIVLNLAKLWAILLLLLAFVIGPSTVVTGVIAVGPALALVALVGIATGFLGGESLPLLILATVFAALTVGTVVGAAMIDHADLSLALGVAGLVLNILTMVALYIGVTAVEDESAADPLPAHMT